MARAHVEQFGVAQSAGNRPFMQRIRPDRHVAWNPGGFDRRVVHVPLATCRKGAFAALVTNGSSKKVLNVAGRRCSFVLFSPASAGGRRTTGRAAPHDRFATIAPARAATGRNLVAASTPGSCSPTALTVSNALAGGCFMLLLSFEVRFLARRHSIAYRRGSDHPGASMPVCPKCKRQYAAAPPVMLPKCPACGFDPSRPAAVPARGAAPPAAGPSVKDQIDRGLQPTAQIYRTDPVAKEILAIADAEAGLEKKRIKLPGEAHELQLIGST